MTRLRTASLGAISFGAIAAVTLLAGCSVDGTATRAAGENTTTATDTTGIPTLPAPTTAPSGAPITSDGAFRISTAGEVAVAVTVVEDLACPACKAFEAAYGDTLDEISKMPGAAVDYRIISFLDRMSSDDYSSRAANASYCVWNRPGDNASRQATWLKFQRSAFTNQPSEGGKGLPDSQLISLAKAAGATDVDSCISSKKYASEVTATTKATMDQPGFSGTPTIMVNGQPVDLRSVATLLGQVKDLLPK